jgi:protein subunit release factor A
MELTAWADCRTRKQSYREAYHTLEAKLREKLAAERAASKKARRDHNISNMRTIRTYSFPRNTVKDHRSGKTASLDKVLNRGQINLLHKSF